MKALRIPMTFHYMFPLLIEIFRDSADAQK